jgi:hypothetical protein
MEQTTNAEKQARYRKKEELKRRAENVLRKWQLEPWNHHSRSFQDVQHLIAKAIDLPSGWTEEEYQIAEVKLEHVNAELSLGVNQISNDLHESSNFDSQFMTTPDPAKLQVDFKEAVKNTTSLASHIISALKLSGGNEAEQAAALMEAARFVGRSLVMSADIPCSEATAMCLATIYPHYVRPNWFPKKLAEALSKNIDQKLSNELGKHLTEVGKPPTR